MNLNRSQSSNRQVSSPTRNPLPRLAWLLLAPGLASVLTGCGMVGTSITGSGQLVTRDYALADFSKVQAGHAFQVEMVQGPQHQVTVTVDDNLVDRLDVSKSGETLRISLQPHLNIRNATMKAKVTLPVLEGVDLSGAAQGTLSGFESDKALEVELSGASQLRGEIKNGDAVIGISGASHVRLRGSARSLKVDASGASHADLDDYAAGNTKADASGASEISVNVNGEIDAEATGASSVRYQGKPTTIRERTSGSSSVRRR